MWQVARAEPSRSSGFQRAGSPAYSGALLTARACLPGLVTVAFRL